MSVVTKVVMQMNAKLGGELWSVHIPMKKVMYVGIDTYHDSGSQRSVGGFVASMNDLCTRYFSKTTWQPSKQELISQLEVCMTDALKQYHEKNGAYPDRVIVFRFVKSNFNLVTSCKSFDGWPARPSARICAGSVRSHYTSERLNLLSPT